MKNIFGPILFLGLLLSCNGTVDIPEPDQSQTVFKTDFNLNGGNDSYAAGKEGYVVDATFDEVNGQVKFVSTFKMKDCDSKCPESLSFSLYSMQPVGAKFDISKSVKPGQLEFNAMFRKDSQQLVVNHLSEGDPQRSFFSYDKKIININNNSSKTLINVPRGKDVEICLEDLTTRIGKSKQCQTFDIKRNVPPRVKLTVNNPKEAILEAVPVKPFDDTRASFSWMTAASGKFFRVDPVTVINNEVCVDVTYERDSNLKSRSCMTSERKLEFFNLISHFEVVNLLDLPVTNKPLNGKVEIDYLDADGQQYSSALFPQDPNTQFEVFSIEDFYDSSLEENIKLVKVGFQAKLFKNYFETKEIKSDTTVLAIRYPQ